MLDFLKFGRLENPDERDAMFGVAEILPDPDPFVTEKYWWDDGWWGNQGDTFYCVAFSWMHLVEDGPVIQDGIPNRDSKPMFDPSEFFHECQLRDPWPGVNYNGTSIRAAAKVLKELGVVKEYRWAMNVDEMAQTVLNLGPVAVGTGWTHDMAMPLPNGLIRTTGPSMGGHAYCINGVDMTKRLFRIKNSWGRDWGKNGYAFISFDDFQGLMNNGGECCIAFENKMTVLPSLSNLSAPVDMV